MLSTSGGPKPQDVPGSITLSEIVTLERKKAGVLKIPAPRPKNSANLPPIDPLQAKSNLEASTEPESQEAATDPETAHHSSGGQTDPYIAEAIHAMNHAKKYPQASIDNEEQGVVLLLVAVERSGQLQVLEILKTSGFQRLDRSALTSVSDLKRFAPLPDRFHAPLLLKIPIRYSIRY